MKSPLLTALLLAPALSAHAAEWTLDWKPAADEKTPPKAEVCPLKYGKDWAYSVEIDDSPIVTLTAAEPLLRQFTYTDAPSGVAGGKDMPFVGGAAVMLVRVVTTNSNYLNWDNLRELEGRGWRAVNHSYWHSGNHWDPAKKLPPEQMRRELYWSQSLLAALLWNNQHSDTTFVYPAGDYNYRPFLKEFGILSATRVGAKYHDLRGAPETFEDLNRNYLDEDVWVHNGGDPLHDLPKTDPAPGDYVIDFTHGIKPEADSPNHQRWTERLKHIAGTYAKGGKDNLWCAPTSEVTSYALAARAARAETTPGHLKLTLPDTAPGSCLTVKLTGLSPASSLKPPAGTILHRRGSEAWITTPALGHLGSVPPKPLLKCVYRGPVKDVKFDHPELIAGVRFQQVGNPQAGLVFQITAVKPDGTLDKLVPEGQTTLANGWGVWLLFPVVPDRPPVSAEEVRVTPDPSLKEMEVWAVAG